MIEKPEKKRHTIQIIYLTNTTNPTNVQLSTEHSQFQWIAINELNQLDTFEDVPAILQEARKRLENLKEWLLRQKLTPLISVPMQNF